MTSEIDHRTTNRRLFNGRNLLLLVALLAVAGIAFYFLWKHHEESLSIETTQVNTVVSVPTVPVVSKTLFREDQLPGEIDAYQDVLIYPKVPGFVQWLGVDRGS